MNAIDVSLALTIGTTALFGSWHCGAMCGPIAIALGRRGALWSYHLGRGLSYAGLGALAGTAGQSFVPSPDSNLRLMAFVLLSLIFLASLFAPSIGFDKVGSSLYRRVSRQRPGLFVFGLASVLLPCGWLWSFIAAAGATGTPTSGALVLTALWLSSLPVLSLANKAFGVSVNHAPAGRARWVPYVLAVAGLSSLWSHFFAH